ncbi:MAG: fatty acid desaturase family protein [Bacteroidota bacterium]|nr:fatty acid desaturase family protein [Bacteroidota bacterium]
MSKVNVNDYLTKEEIQQLLKKSDWKAALEFLHTWVWIAFAFAIAGLWLNPFTIIIAMFIIGGKQLACAILMHDCAHRSMFNSKWANTFFGNWLAGYPILHDVERYRPYHIEHHVKTGTDDDPDLSLTKGYPTTIISFIRKVIRDLIGASGIKGHIAVLVMHYGYIKYELGGRIIKTDQQGGFIKGITTFVENMAGPVAVNFMIFGILWLFGEPWLYLLWIGSLLTTYNFSLRIRSIAEHSAVPDRLDDYKNTRTIYSNFFEKILFAPHHVNYHAEHHLLMTVPSYNFPAMHHLIKERGFYQKGLLKNNYIQILKLAIKK